MGDAKRDPTSNQRREYQSMSLQTWENQSYTRQNLKNKDKGHDMDWRKHKRYACHSNHCKSKTAVTSYDACYEDGNNGDNQREKIEIKKVQIFCSVLKILIRKTKYHQTNDTSRDCRKNQIWVFF